MAIYGIEASGNSLDVLKWPSRKEAQRAGNNWLLIETEQELAGSSVSTKTLAELWNKHNPTESLKRFADRELGAKKVFPLLEKHAITPKEFSKAQETASQQEEEEDNDMAKTATKKTVAKKAPAAKKAVAGGGARRGATSKYAGKKLHATGKENTRRVGTHGHKSMGIILANKGITFEDYVKKGGRPNDLEWDVGKGNVEVK